MARRRIKREKIVGVHADQIRWPHDQCRRSPLRRSSGCGAAPAAGCRDWRQPPTAHREKQARRCRRCRLPQRCCGPWLTETCGVHRRRATGEPCRPSGSHSRRRVVGEKLRYRAAASAARSCPLAVARFALMPVNLLSSRNFQGGSIPARRSGSLLDRRTRDADVVDHQRPVGATLLSRAAPYWPCRPI